MEPLWTIEPLHADVVLPSRATAQSAGYDLHAYLADRNVTCYTPDNHPYTISCTAAALQLLPGHRALVPLGFKAQLPEGYEAQIRPRSGLAVKQGLTVANAPGTIDADYPHEWMAVLVNTAKVPVALSHGDRVAQAVLARYETLAVAPGTVGITTERTGGFGSTGQ